MSVIRIKKTDNFTTMSNHHLRNEELSYKAVGLLSYLLHLPNDWEINSVDLRNRHADGKDSIASGMKELIANGYVTREMKRIKGKIDGYDYTVYEIPYAGNPSTGKPSADKPSAENPQQVKTKRLKTKKVNTKPTKRRRRRKRTGKEVEPKKTLKERSMDFFQRYSKALRSYERRMDLTKVEVEKKFRTLNDDERNTIEKYLDNYTAEKGKYIFSMGRFFNSKVFTDWETEYKNSSPAKQTESLTREQIMDIPSIVKKRRLWKENFPSEPYPTDVED